MIMKFFFELIQISLGNKSKFDSVPTVEDWMHLFEEAQRQAIIGVLLIGIEHLPIEQRPPKVLLLQWIALSQISESVVRQHVGCAAELTTIFDNHGYKSCVLKGVGIALLYPNPFRRQCGDIDFLVNGNRKDIMAWMRREYEVGEIRWHHADVKIYDKVQTEIHFHATWLFNPLYNNRLQKWLDKNGLILCKKTDHGFYVPSLEYNTVYSLIHSFHHLLESGIGFRHIIDYYYIIRNLPLEHRNDLLQTMETLGLSRFLSAVMWVLSSICGVPTKYLLCEPNEVEGRFLLSEIIAGGNFGHSRTDGKGHNSLQRYYIMAKHYPHEVIWMVPWKMWHWSWRMFGV